MALLRSIPPRILATTGSRVRSWCRRRRLPGAVSMRERKCRSPKDKIRHVGEPLAVVLAESRYIAEDALADIVVELDTLPAVVDLEKALARQFRDGARRRPRQSRRTCPTDSRQLRSRPDQGCRISSRGAFFTITAPLRRLKPAASSPDGMPAPTNSRSGTPRRRRYFCAMGLAGMLGLSERQVRVIAPFVGGGFGPENHDVLSRRDHRSRGRQSSSIGRSNGSKTGSSISSPLPMNAVRPMTPKSRSTLTAASSASGTSFSTIPAPTIPTA